MKNPITMSMAVMSFAAGASSYSVFDRSSSYGGSQAGSGRSLNAKKLDISRSSLGCADSVTSQSASRLGNNAQSKNAMRYSVTNTHRIYPFGRDSREALVVLGWESLIQAIMTSTESQTSKMGVSQGNIQDFSHTLGNDSPLKEAPDLPSSLSVDHDATLHSVRSHGLQVVGGHGDHLHTTTHHLPVAHVPAGGLHHEGLSANDLLREVSLHSGVTPQGKGSTPSVVLSGGLTLAMLSGIAHGATTLDHVAMVKLQHWPAVHHGAEMLNHRLAHLIDQLGALKSPGRIEKAVADAVRFSSLETVLDPEDPSSIRSVKLNIKPVAGGPTVSLLLTASEKTGGSGENGIAINKKEFSIDLPTGSLTLTMPNSEVRSGEYNYLGKISDHAFQPIVLSFVSGNSGAEFTLAKVDVPLGAVEK